MKKPAGAIQLDMGRLLDALESKQHSWDMSQRQVADVLKIHDSTIRQWYRGFTMSGDVALRLAIWLDIDLRDFARPPAALDPATKGQAA